MGLTYLRDAWRSLSKQPMFSAVVILTLGLAIGANSAIFSVIDAALLRPLRIRDADRFVNVYTTDSTGRRVDNSSYPDYTYLRDKARGLDGVIGHSGLMATITGGRPEFVFGEIVTGNYFAVTGAPIALGRGFLPEEDRVPGAAPVVVISDRLWRRRFAADPSVVGKPIRLNGQPYTIVGVAAPEFTGLLFRGLSTELWAPVMMMGQLRTNHLDNRGERWMFVKARLAPGGTVAQATQSLAAAGVTLAAAFPSTNAGRTFTARATSDVMVNPDGDRVALPAALFILVAVGFVVLIAATNAGNLMFARAAGREREIAVRLSLGASRSQIVGQLLSEGLVLALLGGALGLGLATVLAHALVKYRPPIPVPISLDVGVDARVITFTIILTALAALIFSLLPALQASRPSLTSSLTGARAVARRRSGLMRLRQMFLVPQLTLSLVLLVVAGLLGRSVMRAGAVDVGFDVQSTAQLALNLKLDGYDTTRARAFYSELARRFESRAPGNVLGVTNRVPLDMFGSSTSVVASGADVDDRPVEYAGVDDKYFSTLGIALMSGRAFTESEVSTRAPVAIVSEALARRHWPAGNAVGQTLWQSPRGEARVGLTVIGVARDAKMMTLGEAPQPVLYRPIDRDYSRLLRVVARSTDDPAATAGALRRDVAAIDPDVAIFQSSSMAEHVSVRLYPYRVGALVSLLVGGFGLLISSVGLFGMVAFNVSRRTREFGIRAASGATPRAIVRMVLLEQSRVIAIAVALGLVIALGAARALASVVFGISWADPLTLAGVVATLSGVAFVAGYIPAKRATRISPATALRQD